MSIAYTTVRRKGRRTARLTVAPDDSMVITVPAHLSDEQVAGLMRRKSTWVRTKIVFSREVLHPHRRKEVTAQALR